MSPTYFNPRSPHGERLACEESQAVTIDFNPRSPHGERLLGGRAIFAAPHFNPRSPHGERLAPPTVSAPSAVISIHAPRTGSDVLCGNRWRETLRISIHAPRTGSDKADDFPALVVRISIHAPRTGSDHQRHAPAPAPRISIHAPRTGSDAGGGVFRRALVISIHAPRTGSDLVVAAHQPLHVISIHAPRTGSDYDVMWSQTVGSISIHAPRTGSDMQELAAYTRVKAFQSTLPARGATEADNPRPGCTRISIHAPRTGSDLPSGVDGGREVYFNPRSPHGERPGYGQDVISIADFNPRSPHGERLYAWGSVAIFNSISIHAPRTGSDGMRTQDEIRETLFQSTLPARGATWYVQGDSAEQCISIHAPRTGSDFRRQVARFYLRISIHAPRTGSDPVGDVFRSRSRNFNPRSPHGERRAKSSSTRRICPFQSTLPARGATTTGKNCTRKQLHFNPRSPHGERLVFSYW